MVDGDVVAVRAVDPYPEEITCAFRDALSLAQQPRSTLYTLYQGWIDVLHALRAARVTGAFSIPPSRTEAVERAATLRESTEIWSAGSPICGQPPNRRTRLDAG